MAQAGLQTKRGPLPSAFSKLRKARHRFKIIERYRVAHVAFGGVAEGLEIPRAGHALGQGVVHHTAAALAVAHRAVELWQIPALLHEGAQPEL